MQLQLLITFNAYYKKNLIGDNSEDREQSLPNSKNN